MTEQQINWGIIGAGKIAEKFALDLKDVPKSKLIAIASRNLKKAKIFIEKHIIEVAYGDYKELVEDPNIDAIYVATPHSLHKKHAILCLNNKKAVLCEKPFAMNLQEVDDIIACAQVNNTLVMEALWTSFLPHFKYVQNLLNEDYYGKVLELHADFGFYPAYDENSRVFNKSLGGGSLLDIGIYPVFVALSTLGLPDTIEAEAQFFATGADAKCNIVFHYQKTKAYLKSSLLEDTNTEAIFKCERGTIKINKRFHEPSTVTLTDQNGLTELKSFNYSTLGYNYEIEHFNQLIRDGKTESNIMSFTKSRELIKTLDAIRQKIKLHY